MRDASRASGSDLEGLTEYVRSLLEASLPPELLYHDAWHTFGDVVPAATRLADEEGLPAAQHELVVAAALLHDTGFIRGPTDHERHSVEIACEVLPRFGFAKGEAAAVARLILATRVGHTAETPGEAVIMDADLDVLGRPDFWTRNLRLRRELEAFSSTYDDVTWWRGQRQFLRRHAYLTETARRLRDGGKRDNLRRIEAHLDMLAEREADHDDR